MTVEQKTYERMIELEKVVSQACKLLKTNPDKLIDRAIILLRQLNDFQEIERNEQGPASEPSRKLGRDIDYYS